MMIRFKSPCKKLQDFSKSPCKKLKFLQKSRCKKLLNCIQECPQARTSLNYFKLEGLFDVIGTDSLPEILLKASCIFTTAAGYLLFEPRHAL